MEVQWIYNILLVSGVQQSDSIIYIYFLFFSIIVYFKISNIVLCAIHWILVAYLFYIYSCASISPILPIYPCSFFPFGNYKFIFYVYEPVSVL